jgi:hypothetical protein
LNDRRPFSESLVAPRSNTHFSVMSSVPGATTYAVPIPNGVVVTLASRHVRAALGYLIDRPTGAVDEKAVRVLSVASLLMTGAATAMAANDGGGVS